MHLMTMLNFQCYKISAFYRAIWFLQSQKLLKKELCVAICYSYDSQMHTIDNGVCKAWVYQTIHLLLELMNDYFRQP